MAGILYMVATPIGNLEDITYRAVRILEEADLVAAEDTRNSRKLLNHFEIKTPMTSYHEFNRYDKAEVLIEKLESGANIALITDAGTPGISDPGEVLVSMCLDRGIKVVPVPGAVALINALIASGQSTRSFFFQGFIPQDNKEKRAVLEKLSQETATIILYEAPHRLIKTLEQLKETLGAERSMTICRELTKKHEEFIRMNISAALEYYRENEPRGEYVLVIAGKSEEEIKEEMSLAWKDMDITSHVEMYIEQGLPKKDAIKQVAKDRNMPKREVYSEVMK